jgi:threonine aldolase
MKSFASDNNSGIHPKILQAIHNANREHVVAYGNDIYTTRAINKFKEILDPDIDVYFVYGGTGANILGLQSITKSFEGIFCADTAHINCDECGAPEKFTGCKLITIPTLDGKITVEQIKNHFASNWTGSEHHTQPKVISITQTTELGTVYTAEEIKKITEYAHKNNMYVHMDGARIANAVASLNIDIKEITTNAGIDVLSFGGTKNGMMYGDAVIFFNKNLSTNFKFIRKQGMQLASKMRFISAQFEELLSNNLWINNATHANKMAEILSTKVCELGIELTQKTQANAVFAKLPKKHIEQIQKDYFFYVWNEEKSEVRWMTSFDTTQEDINSFVQCIAETLK